MSRTLSHALIALGFALVAGCQMDRPGLTCSAGICGP